MREIKFRAWDKKEHLMYEDFYKWSSFNMYLMGSNNGSTYRYKIMQFTGLKDKNGKEIYEGDILNWDYCGITDYKDWMKDAAYVVMYEDGYKICGKGIKDNLYLHGFRFKHTEVVGNIYQNPNLLN